MMLMKRVLLGAFVAGLAALVCAAQQFPPPQGVASKDLKIEHKGGQTYVMGLFTKFRVPASRCSQDFSASTSSPVGSAFVPQGVPPPGCTKANCPYDSDPWGGCDPGKGELTGTCGICNSYECTSTSSGCCVTCRWNTGDCLYCTTTAGCS